jgi:predicted ester cyclase
MTGQSNVITVERALKAVWSGARRIDRDALFAHSFRFRNLGKGDDVTDLSGLRKRITHMRAAHPYSYLSVVDVFESGDHFVARWAFRMDERTESAPPRREALTALMEGTWVLYLCNGQVVEMWEVDDQLMEVS